MKRIMTGLLVVVAVCLLDPTLSNKLTLAITYFDQPQMPSQDLDTHNDTDTDSSLALATSQTAHAPEPSTLFLFISGIGGMVVQFARRRFARFKRYSDIGLSILGLAATSPILLFAAALIKLNSRGPVIYKQNRVGKFGEIFQIYKLRTMRLDAEKNTGAVWARANDPRITTVGRVLRKAHIDEIPQLFNVLKGQMSIVGPRPERPEMVRDFKNLIVDYERRLQIKPGITGLAQVFRKYDETIEDVKKKIKYDLLYIRRMCLWADLRIMAQTFIVVFTGRGAN